MEVVEEWLTVGEAARRAGRDKRTIRRWVDNHLVVSRRSATGHRQVSAASLAAVLSTGPTQVSERTDPLAGRLMLERWIQEAMVLTRWTPDPRTPVGTLETWRSQLSVVDDALAYLRLELDAAIFASDD